VHHLDRESWQDALPLRDQNRTTFDALNGVYPTGLDWSSKMIPVTKSEVQQWLAESGFGHHEVSEADKRARERARNQFMQELQRLFPERPDETDSFAV
jgi:hypothetical protein